MIDPERINNIIGLSNKLGNDPQKIIDMMKHHTAEINELHKNKDTHFAIETGDLIILCIQLLMIEGYSTKKIMETCYDRFDKKLNQLITQKNQG